MATERALKSMVESFKRCVRNASCPNCGFHDMTPYVGTNGLYIFCRKCEYTVSDMYAFRTATCNGGCQCR